MKLMIIKMYTNEVTKLRVTIIVMVMECISIESLFHKYGITLTIL